jgi:hypothetical protein
MTTQITLTIPEGVLKTADRLARQLGRPVQDLLAETLELSFPPQGRSQTLPTAGQSPAPPADFPRVGTPEWGRMNRRRAELIRKEIAGTLTPDERQEYELLQRESLAALDGAFPRPAPTCAGAEAPGA